LAIYKTVLIIFPLNLQTITVTLDAGIWSEGVPCPYVNSGKVQKSRPTGTGYRPAGRQGGDKAAETHMAKLLIIHCQLALAKNQHIHFKHDASLPYPSDALSQSASEITYNVSGGAFNFTHSPPHCTTSVVSALVANSPSNRTEQLHALFNMSQYQENKAIVKLLISEYSQKKFALILSVTH